MYAQTMANAKMVGTDGWLDTSSLDIRAGELQGYPYVAIVSLASKQAILRGRTRNTKSEAVESFIDAVLLTAEQWRRKIESQREQYIEASRTEEGEGG
jgi:hypothetical protein